MGLSTVLQKMVDEVRKKRERAEIKAERGSIVKSAG